MSNGLLLGHMEGRKDKWDAVKALLNLSVPSKTACRKLMAAFSKKRTWHRVVLNEGMPHTAIFAPTGAGKGVSCIVPFLKTCREPCIVIDPKGGENATLTAADRRRMGHRVVLLDPFKLVTDTPDTLNPLQFVDRESPFAIDDCREIAEAIVERKNEKGDGIHFLDTAEACIATIAAGVVAFCDGEKKSLQELCDFFSKPEEWEAILKGMHASRHWDGILARLAGNLMHLKDRELASTQSTVARFLRFLSTPAIAASTRTSSFDPADLLKGKMDVFLILAPERVSTLSPLLRLWIGTFLRAVFKGQGKAASNIHLVGDEAAQLGEMRQISDALTVGRGMRIRLQLYYQDLGQLNKCWPEGAGQTLLANCNQVFFAPNDLGTAQQLAAVLGKYTQCVSNGGTNWGTSQQSSSKAEGSSDTYSRGGNSGWSLAERELLQASEILTLNPRVAITRIPGKPPICTWLIRYYEGAFNARPSTFWGGLNALWYGACAACLAGLLALLMTHAASQKLGRDPLDLQPQPRSSGTPLQSPFHAK